MNRLTPRQAAQIAAGVYLLRTDSVSNSRERGRQFGAEGLFKVDDSSRIEGVSGSLLWKQLSGFGYIAAGEGRFQGDVLLATRGTSTMSDWLTNLNIAAQSGPSGHLVHAGFNQTWKSISPEVRSFLQGRNPTTVHCVGHSLGGALAMLNADFLSQQKVGKVVVYTFGAPRTGMHWFSKELTRRLGADSVLRLSHPADPVPMIPIFPFCHAPYDQTGLIVPDGGRGISVEAHFMDASYLPAVGDSDWSAFRAPAPQDSGSAGGGIQAWLDNPASIAGLRMMSSQLLSLTARALRWVLAKARDVVVGAVGTTVMVGATVIDQFAWLLSQGAALSVKVAGYVNTIIRAIFTFLGRSIGAAVDLTSAFLSWVLGLLFNSLSSVATRALSLVR